MYSSPGEGKVTVPMAMLLTQRHAELELEVCVGCGLWQKSRRVVGHREGTAQGLLPALSGVRLLSLGHFSPSCQV